MLLPASCNLLSFVTGFDSWIWVSQDDDGLKAKFDFERPINPTQSFTGRKHPLSLVCGGISFFKGKSYFCSSYRVEQRGL